MVHIAISCILFVLRLNSLKIIINKKSKNHIGTWMLGCAHILINFNLGSDPKRFDISGTIFINFTRL